jgi:hypothetical protein
MRKTLQWAELPVLVCIILERWLDELADVAELELPPRTGWRAVRRKFATSTHVFVVAYLAVEMVIMLGVLGVVRLVVRSLSKSRNNPTENQ